VERDAELAKAILTFDIDRCVIGTKLETYFLSHSLAARWTTFADELTLFSAGSTSQDLERRLYRGSSEDCIRERKQAAAKAAADRREWVDADWGVTEQLFLAQKLELLTSVRVDPMTPQPRYSEGSITCFMWSSISFVTVCLAFLGKMLADEDNQRAGETAFAVLAVVAAVLGIVLLLVGLLRRTHALPESRLPRET
jgi:hypothetical protein